MKNIVITLELLSIKIQYNTQFSLMEISQEILEKTKLQIPLYKQTKSKLYSYLITKELPVLEISNDDYLKCVDFVFQAATGIGEKASKKSIVIGKQKEAVKEIEYKEKFYEVYKADLSSFALSLVHNLKKLKETQSWFFISTVHDQIRSYKIFMYKLFKIFRHIDSSFLKTKRKDIHVEGAIIFKKMYIETIYTDLFQKITQMITMYKEGKPMNKSILEEVIRHIAICGFQEIRDSIQISKATHFSECEFQAKGWEPYQSQYFKQKFITPMVNFVEKQYQKKTIGLLKLSTPEYVKQSLRFLELEQKIADSFYDHDTPRKVIICSVSNILANENGKVIMNNEKTGAYVMLESRNFEQLNQLYILIKQSDLIPYLSLIFQKFIDKQGTMILEKITPEDEKQLKKQKVSQVIVKLLELKDLADSIVTKAFNGDIKLQQGRDTALHTLINRTVKVTNFLCYYIDAELRKQKDDSEAQSTITGILKLFRYIYSTDAFFKTYQKHLCMRVLNDNFKNKDMENDLISQLKAEAGAGALSKITTMIKDISDGEKFNEDFIKTNKSLIINDIEFKLMILTGGSWPIYNPKIGSENVPETLIQPIKQLDQIYSKKFPGKVLNWIFSYGSALLSVKFKTGGSFMLTVGGFQLIILSQFIDSRVEAIKIEDIIKKVKTEELNNFNASVLGLVKLKVLIKDGEQGKVDPSNILTFNEQFTYKSRRVNCVPVQKNVEKISPQITQQILKERQTLIDSIIVKIMKARKINKYQDCVTETMAMCKVFKVDLSFIKRRIEALIEKDFLKRDEKESNILIYTP